MARFFRKKVVRRAPKKAVRAGGRRLQFGEAAAVVVGANAVKRGYQRMVAKPAYRKAVRNYRNRLEATDNITTAPAIVIGKQKKISFQEKVSRAFRPPSQFKRNYQWSAECPSGRKAYFCVEINIMNTLDLTPDITSYKQALLTNTSSTDNNVRPNGLADGARFYVEYLKEVLKMVNSSTNAITGKVHLYAYKRDSDNTFAGTNTHITPINLAMYYNTFGGTSTLINGSGGENIVGRGWTFDALTAGSNYLSTYNMPGALTANPTGVCAITDPQFSLEMKSIKERMGFWFRKVKTNSFSLKPGQQFDSTIIINDTPKIFREQQEFIHIKGISYCLVVEFQGGIVGSQVAGASGDGVISTGSVQLSCIRESVRILGLENTLVPQVFLQTAPLTQIANADQFVINPDTGAGDIGMEQDNV